jgi:2-polyprenyl-3-methyl-5-hydroxy-6-metoxy-1,4-benzoquinol methylase
MNIIRRLISHSYPPVGFAAWPLSLPSTTSAGQVRELQEKADQLGNDSPLGWGHSINFGPFQKEGCLGNHYLKIVQCLDQWGWWPTSMAGWKIADVGCFTGALSVLMASRGDETVYAVDELPEHLDQCRFLADTFGFTTVRPVLSSLYGLHEKIPAGSLDMILLSGVLYHLSDMLVGLYLLRGLLKPNGILIIATQAVDDEQHSYANFGRFCAGSWWQPSALCIRDMCKFMGFSSPDVKFYQEGQCLARANVRQGDIDFKRGMNWKFDSLNDARQRTKDTRITATVPHTLLRLFGKLRPRPISDEK